MNNRSLGRWQTTPNLRTYTACKIPVPISNGFKSVPHLKSSGGRMDILAWNPLAAALLTDFSQIPEKGSQLRPTGLLRI